MLHPDDVGYFEGLRTKGLLVAVAAGIKVDVIEPKRRPSTGTDGLCYCEERRIAIAVRGKDSAAVGGAWHPQRHTDLRNDRTLAHELAHMLEFQRHGQTNHGERFQQYEQTLQAMVPA